MIGRNGADRPATASGTRRASSPNYLPIASRPLAGADLGRLLRPHSRRRPSLCHGSCRYAEADRTDPRLRRPDRQGTMDARVRLRIHGAIRGRPRASVSIDEGCACAGYDGKSALLRRQGWHGPVVERFNTEYKIRMPIWGIAASPLVDNNQVIVQIGGEDNACLVAFNKQNGQERWRSLSDNASYSAPIIIQQAGKRVLVAWTGENVAGLDPASGKPYWSIPSSRRGWSSTSPRRSWKKIACSSVVLRRLLMLSSCPTVWPSNKSWPAGPGREADRFAAFDHQHALYGRRYVYGVDSYGELRCLDAKTGDRIWESQQAVPGNAGPRSTWSRMARISGCSTTAASC